PEFSLEYQCHGLTERPWYRVEITPLHSAVAGGAMVMHIDISERKRTEFAMRQTTELLHAVVDGTPDAIFIKDLKGRYLLLNEAAARFVGRSVETVIGVDDHALFSPADASTVIQGDRRVMESGKVLTTEEVLTSVGVTRTYLATKAPYRDERGQVIGVLGISRDITDRKQAELERDRERQLLRTVIDAVPDVVYTMDAVGHFQIGNSAALPLCGVASEPELAGKTVFDIFPAAVAEGFHADDCRVLAGKPVWNREERGPDVMGEPTWYLTTKVPLRDGKGEIVGLVSISRDVTVQKRAQEEARRTAEQLSTTLASLTDGFYTLDRDWRFTYLNPEAKRLLRLSSDALNKQTVWDIFPHLRESAFGAALQRAMAGETMVQVTDYYRPLEGWFDIRLFPSAQGVAVYLRDVTEQRKLALALERERTRLVAAQALARSGDWSTDALTGVSEWSDETYRIFGTDRSRFEPTYAGFLALVHPDDRETVAAAFANSLEQDGTNVLEHRLLLSGGVVKFVEERWQVTRDDKGVPIRSFGTCQDITERKHTENVLRQNQAVLNMAGRLARMGAWSVDVPDGTVVWSDEVCAIHDMPSGTVPTVDEALSYYPPEWIGLLRHAAEACAESGTPFDLEAEIITARGRRVWVRTIGEAFRDASGVIRRIQGAFQDLSERKQAELETRKLADRLTSTLESLTDAFYTVDHEWRFTYVNAAAERMLNRQREDLLGSILWEEFPLLRTSPFAEEYYRAVREKRPISIEAYFPPQDVWLHVNAYPAEDSLAVYVRDITERKRDQEALLKLNLELEARVQARTAELNLAREEAELANRAKSGFLAAMSHEIRTPMNGVIGMVDVLHQTSLKGYQVEMVDLIRESAFSLLKIIDDILDFSKIEAGRLTIDTEPMRLAETVEKVCAMLDHMAVKGGVRMTAFVDPAIPRMLVGDPTRLRQVLVNLVANAIKFSSGLERPGCVSVRALLVQESADGATVDLDVSDNGIGMDNATLGRLFTPFSQADASTTRRFGGTGLGLAISSMLVHLMDGAITVRSEPDRGSTFNVRLRLAIAEDQGVDDPAVAMVKGLRCRIIGAEMPLAGDLDAYLNHAGAIVERFSDLSAAAAAESSPGLCIWLVLPDQSIESLDHLRALAPDAPDVQTRFVVFDHGSRRRPRVESPDVVTIDADSLFRRMFFRALALASGRMQEGTEQEDSLETYPVKLERQEARQMGRLILVAEDNETNQKVILRQLGLIGYAAEFAANGREALERWRSGDFALLITDLHMPQMDGYALASTIRAEERPGHRIPIIALTANALRDEELRCRAAGMDAYLTKPVRLPHLKGTMEELLGVGSAAGGHEHEGRSAKAPPVDLSVLRSLVGDDPAVIDEILQAFRVSSRQSSTELTHGMASGKAMMVADAAHRLKSGARSIGARRLGELCAAIEEAAEVGAEGLPNLLTQFESELDAVHRFLDSR
ncbi:MAG: PAS domain-containing protein, partial [Burkholderiales bacterium]|nr:PAS domain-containing protein [Burkholderiales bacterium]